VLDSYDHHEKYWKLGFTPQRNPKNAKVLDLPIIITPILSNHLEKASYFRIGWPLSPLSPLGPTSAMASFMARCNDAFTSRITRWGVCWNCLSNMGTITKLWHLGDFPAMFQYQRIPMMSLGLSHDLLVGRWGIGEQKFTPRLGIVKAIHAYKRYKVRQSCPIIGISSLLESGGIPPLLHTCRLLPVSNHPTFIHFRGMRVWSIEFHQRPSPLLGWCWGWFDTSFTRILNNLQHIYIYVHICVCVSFIWINYH
jgi:hypothetical protein